MHQKLQLKPSNTTFVNDLKSIRNTDISEITFQNEQHLEVKYCMYLIHVYDSTESLQMYTVTDNLFQCCAVPISGTQLTPATQASLLPGSYCK